MIHILKTLCLYHNTCWTIHHNKPSVLIWEKLKDMFIWSLLNRVPYVPYVPSCLACPRALMPCVPTCTRALRAQVPTCPRALVPCMPSCLACPRTLRVQVPSFHTFSWPKWFACIENKIILLDNWINVYFFVSTSIVICVFWQTQK